MTPNRPSPPVPAEVDLRDFAFTPMYRARLFGSTFNAKSNDSEWRAGVTLWLKSQDQVPAGSLPNDDTELCRLAELGRDLKTWRKIRENALHGWFECSDGRLYNTVTAEIAVSQWQSKIAQRNRTTKARIAALEKRLSQATDRSVTDDINAQLQALRRSISRPVTEAATEDVTASKRREVKGDLRDKVLNGHASDFEKFWEVYPCRVDRRAAERAFVKALDRAESAVIVEGARRYAKSRNGEDKKFTKRPQNWLDGDGWTEFGGAKPLTPEQDAASRDKADRLLKRGKYAERQE